MSDEAVRRRPSTREEQEMIRPGEIDHVARAKMRIEQLRLELGDSFDGGEFYIDKFYAEAPPGWVYNWKNFSVFEREERKYQAQMMRNGWSPVEASRHRDLLYPEYEDQFIIIDGMMLMERPKEMNDKRVEAEKLKAKIQVAANEARLSEAPPGTAPRDQFAFTRPNISGHTGPVVPD